MKVRWALSSLVLGMIAAIVLTREVEWPQLWLFDFYQRLSPATRESSQIAIVDIDGESVRRIGPWPWPRDRLAQLIDKARGARVIGVDILLLDADRAAGADLDARLVAAIGRARAVLPATRGDVADADDSPVIAVTPVLQAGSDADRFVPSVATIGWPLAIFAQAASGTGLALVLAERDGIVRRLPTIYAAGATLLPSFAVEVLRVAAGEKLLQVRSSAAGVERIAVGEASIPTDGNGAVWPRFARGVPARIFSAGRLLTEAVDPAWFSGRIVLIGSSLAGLGDIHLTPLRETETGTAINAQFVASALAGDTLWRPAVADAAEAVLLTLLGVASVVLFGRVSGRLQAGLVTGSAVILIGASFGAFALFGMLLDWTLPVSGMIAVNLGLSAIRARDDRRGRRGAEADLGTALAEVDSARQVVTQALNSSKMATLGELAAVLAHELRQPIATMSLAAENADASLQDGSLDVADARVRIDRIIAQAKRAESIISHLGVFARADQSATGPVDLADAVHDALELVGPSLQRHGIGVEVICAPDLPPALAVKILLEQVIINLCVNAQDALRSAQTRSITLSLGAVNADRSQVQLAVTDSGPGISEQALPHVFEPFFTTKVAGEGTGLGLAVCRRIVESLGGSITAHNGKPSGAVFVVLLPAAAISRET